ncbi:MAG: trypsin-like peptidase domain-containing protein [Terriglobales bacterium]
MKAKQTALAFAMLLTIYPLQTAAQRDVPYDNLEYPVLITLTNCEPNINVTVKGSGFFMNTDSSTLLVTARHLLFNWSAPNHPLLCKTAELVSYSPDPKEQEKNRVILDLVTMSASNAVKAHATQDVAVVHIGDVVAAAAGGRRSISPTAGVRVITNAPSGIVGASVDLVKKLDKVLISNAVYVFGFPTSIGIQSIPQIEYDRPLIRKGVVAGINEANKTIILDCLIFQGNSGGPVIQAEREAFATKFYVVGVVSQFVPVTETWINSTLSYSNTQVYNSGYSVAVPMDAVLEILGH